MRRHPNIKPLDILWQNGIESYVFSGIIAGVWDTLRLAGVAGELPIFSRGMATYPPFPYQHDQETLHPRIDLEPFLAMAREQSKLPGCLNATVLLNELRRSANYQDKKRYALIIVKEKIHWSHPNSNYYGEKGGCAYRGESAVISMNSYLEYWINQIQNFDLFVLATRRTTVHELKHIFEPETTQVTHPTGDVHQDMLDAHCKNACAMRLNVDIEFYQTIQNNPLCPSCLEKLRAYFTTAP